MIQLGTLWPTPVDPQLWLHQLATNQLPAQRGTVGMVALDDVIHLI